MSAVPPVRPDLELSEGYHSPQVEAENEIDDLAQMIEAQNEIRRRRGKPERTLEDIESEWRGS